MKQKLFVTICIAAVSQFSNAELLSLPAQEIISIRGESNVALLGFAQGFPSESGCGGRVWIPVDNDPGKSKLGMAMMAFASDKKVAVRSSSTSTKRFSECEIYDIVVYQ